MARLTRAETRLLEFPPTEETWVCRGKIRSLDGVLSPCAFINNGRNDVCMLCRAPKGKRPTKLWPKYTAACKKVGIDPTLRKSYTGDADVPTPRKRRRSTKRS